MFISGKNQYNVPNSEPKPQSEPSDTACLIRKAPQIWHRINVLQPPPAPPGAPKHPRWVYYPQNTKFPAPIPPQRAQQRAHHPITASGIVYMYLLIPLPLLNSPALLYSPALSSGTPGISTILPAKPKYPITNPDQPRHYGKTFKFWVVGNTRCGLMI